VSDPATFLTGSSPLTGEWEALADRCYAGPFLRAGWFRAWWRAFGTGEMRILTARERETNRLVALLVLRRRRRAVTSATNWHTPDYGILAEGSVAAEPLLSAVFEARPRAVDLRFLPQADADQVAGRATSAGYRVLRRTVQRSPYLVIDGQWQVYEQTIGAHVRRELSRRRRKLAQQGLLELVVEDGSQRLGELLAEGLSVEASGWKAQRDTAIDSRPETRRFYVELAEWAADRGWLRLAFLRLNGRALAFDFCLEHAGVHYLLKTGYDPAFRAFAPGKLIRYDMLARAFHGGLRCYEFLGMDDDWKREWTQTSHDRMCVQAFRASTVGTLDWLAHAYGRPAGVFIAERAGLRRGAARAAAPS
jgi:CelD/BcsL family acetyltransferase involved in cellulose biosynthesis